MGSCGRPLGERVAIGRASSRGGGHRGVVTGVETCGSASGCLKCARKVRAEKASDTGEVISIHLDRGGHGLFLSLTFSHSLDDAAAESLDDALTAWSSMTNTRRWKRFERWVGMDGWIRATENTHSEANGFHPHHHCALLTELAVGLDEDDPWQLELVRQEIDAMWRLAVEKLGRDVHPDIGVDLRPIRDHAGIGEYVSKIEMEIGRGDLKHGREGSRSTWDIGLDAADGDKRSAALWAEYIGAAKGRHWLSTSRGLWAKFGITDRSDQEIAEEKPDEVDQVAFIDRAVYTAAAKDEGLALAEVRHLVEANASVVVLAIVLSRRLGRMVTIEHRLEDEGLPTLVWATNQVVKKRSDE